MRTVTGVTIEAIMGRIPHLERLAKESDYSRDTCDLAQYIVNILGNTVQLVEQLEKRIEGEALRKSVLPAASTDDIDTFGACPTCSGQITTLRLCPDCGNAGYSIIGTGIGNVAGGK